MKQVNNVLLGLVLIFGLAISFSQNYDGRTINIQPLVPNTNVQTGNTNRAINASQTLTYGQTIDTQYQFKINELEARIIQLEQLNADAQNRIAALESSHNSLANQIASVQNGSNNGSTTTTQTTSGNSYLQVGAFSRFDLAQQLVYKLQQLGYQVYDSSSNGVMKLFVGPFDNSRLAEEQYRLSLQNITDSFPIAVP